MNVSPAPIVSTIAVDCGVGFQAFTLAHSFSLPSCVLLCTQVAPEEPQVQISIALRLPLASLSRTRVTYLMALTQVSILEAGPLESCVDPCTIWPGQH